MMLSLSNYKQSYGIDGPYWPIRRDDKHDDLPLWEFNGDLMMFNDV